MIILHGDNQVASRHFLVGLKQAAVSAGKNPVDLPGDGLTPDRLESVLGGQSLFGVPTKVFIEGFFSRRQSAEKQAVTSYLLLHLPTDLVLWEAKDVSAQLKTFPVETIRRFDLPKLVFKFLDQLSLPTLEQALTTTSAEMTTALLVGRIRQLLLIKAGHLSGLAAWQAAKLRLQIQRYSLGQLLAAYRRLLTLDAAQKTSAVPYDLATALQLWVMELS